MPYVLPESLRIFFKNFCFFLILADLVSTVKSSKKGHAALSKQRYFRNPRTKNFLLMLLGKVLVLGILYVRKYITVI